MQVKPAAYGYSNLLYCTVWVLYNGNCTVAQFGFRFGDDDPAFLKEESRKWEKKAGAPRVLVFVCGEEARSVRPWIKGALDMCSSEVK